VRAAQLGRALVFTVPNFHFSWSNPDFSWSILHFNVKIHIFDAKITIFHPVPPPMPPKALYRPRPEPRRMKD
jgi:hypothetical protein